MSYSQGAAGASRGLNHGLPPTAISGMPQPAPARTAMDTLLHQLGGMRLYTDRIETVLDRAAGYGPEERGNDAPSPAALLDRIAIVVNDLRARLESAADRLERIA